MIVPTRRAADGSKVLALPKGHPDAGESAADAALREVREEAGVDGAPCARSSATCATSTSAAGGGSRRSSASSCSTTSRGEPEEHDHEVEEARWMPLEEAAQQLTYKGERDMAARALQRLRPVGCSPRCRS